MKLNRTNLFQTAITTTVEILESLVWIALGFISTVVVLEIRYNSGSEGKTLQNMIQKKELRYYGEMSVWR